MASKPRRKTPAPQSVAVSGLQPSGSGDAVQQVRTVIYVHGIGNKPMPSVLKCQWDTALFRTRMGDRTRMAYWVNRTRYPEPVNATCADRDSVAVDDDQATAASIMTVAASATPAQANDPAEPLQRQIAALTDDPRQLRTLHAIADRIGAHDSPAEGVDGVSIAGAAIRVLPLPEPLRLLVTAQLTRALAPDVYDFLFDEQRRAAMTAELRSRLNPKDGPFAVIAHSQGSMVAFEVLQSLDPKDYPVELFITIGSPLGLQEVKDAFLQRKIPLRVPACVKRWVNAADRLDPIAIDASLSDDYAAQANGKPIEDVSVSNRDSPRNPHSATGYLRTGAVQEAVIEMAGGALSQPIGRTIVSSDVVEQMEDAPETPQEVLIELAEFDTGIGVPRPLTEARDALLMQLSTLSARRSGTKLGEIVPDVLQRFVAADLIRSEVEALRSDAAAAGVHRIWRNSVKRTLIDQSAATIQATTANLGYVADGRSIGWAVVDTGISASHPHFDGHRNVRAQWDCLKHGEPPREVNAEESAYFDKNGHGTHVAGVIAGAMGGLLRQGRETRMAGMAPATELYGFRTLNAAGRGRDSSIIKALEQVARINEGAGRLVIHGVNLSLGSAFDPRLYGCGHTPLCEELRRLWRQGVLVCLAAGNEGYVTLQGPGGLVDANLDLTIGDPANLDEAIAVGSVHKTNPHTYGVSFFSSRGPTADGRRKPDLVAPGERILSARRGARVPVPRGAEVSAYYVEMSGTSMATPHVSGLLAGFLSARREFIGYPDRVKRILLDNCTDLQRDPYAQGAGLANLVKMLVAT